MTADRRKIRMKAILGWLKAGLTPAEACLQCSIDPRTYQSWCTKYPAFQRRAQFAQLAFLGEVNSVVCKAATSGEDLVSSRYILDKRHPAYMRQSLAGPVIQAWDCEVIENDINSGGTKAISLSEECSGLLLDESVNDGEGVVIAPSDMVSGQFPASFDPPSSESAPGRT